jgi:hypothetical protein
MPRTTPLTSALTSALAGRGKSVAAAVAVAAVLGGAGAASAATIAGAAPVAHEAAHHVATHAKTAQAEAGHARVVTAAKPAAAAKPASSAKAAPGPAKPASSAKAAAPAHAKAAAPAPAKPAAPAPAPARPAPAPAAAPAPAPPATPYQVYDSVTPTQIPAGARIATYADGGYAAGPAAVAGRSHVTWIDTNASDPRAAALDVEPGDATPVQAATWTWQKLHSAAGDLAIIYTMRSDWPATQAAIATLPAAMQHQVRWWIADPTGVPHIVPGASATQWYWGQNYDISTAAPGSGL